MLCILKIENGEIKGWIIAHDVHDARRQADAAFERELAAELYRMEFVPPAGKHELRTGHVDAGERLGHVGLTARAIVPAKQSTFWR